MPIKGNVPCVEMTEMSIDKPRFRQLLPTTQPALPSISSRELQKRKRVSTQTACNECRRKKSRCDGQHPSCASCRQRSIRCVYTDKRAQDLSAAAGANEVLEVLRSAPESEAVNILRMLRVKNNLSIISILRGLSKDDSSPESMESMEIMKREKDEYEDEDEKEKEEEDCFGQLLSWSTCTRSSDHRLPAKRPKLSTTSSLPPLPLDAYNSCAHMDTWTQTGWTKAHIRHLFDALVTWDYLPFCLLCKELFLQDFYSGSDQFCSSALVHAMLALATRLINESGDDNGILPSGWLHSKFFFQKAESLLSGKAPFSSLPDNQALGILSLYQIRCGREVQAKHLAETFVASITQLCQHEQPEIRQEESDAYDRVRATTYCGAVSLARILCLTTGQKFIGSEGTTQQDTLFLYLLPHCSGVNSQEDEGLRPHLAVNVFPPLLWNLQHLTSRVFQLTDWVHSLLVAAEADIQEALNDVGEVYHRCLNWYKSFFAFLGAESSRTPFIQFIHMYYHFCLLCAFRPFIGFTVEGSTIQPHEICMQAAQSILALAQSYDDLFTVRRVSGFIPYFVCTSGLFSLALEDGRSHPDSSHLGLENASSTILKTKPQGHKTAAGYTGSELSPAFVEISAATHAHLLLKKMGSTHPAAKKADKLVREEAECIQGVEATREEYYRLVKYGVDMI
ncbi:hypothetical protein BGZ63DRAFT_512716 [Mariannaea sp. PMI_226]|nr:hypothetical protein BGZ63DRAFT_512716 [Mariannaea sp. PMI_226]